MEKLKQLIIGSMLGDGYLCKITGGAKNSRLSIAHSKKQKEYCKFKHFILEELNLAGKFCYNKIENDRYKNGYIEEYRFRSKANEVFTRYRNLFYPDDKKVLHKETINEIDELGLAIWFLDDAHKAKVGYQINTQCFSMDEISFLRDLLKRKFNIETTYQPFDNIIYIRSCSVNTFDNLIKPYVIKSMQYKLFNRKRVLDKEDELLES